MINYQFLEKFFSSAGAIFVLTLTTPALAQLPPLSPNQRELFNNFRSRQNSNDPSVLLLQDEYIREQDSRERLERDVDALSHPKEAILEISPELQRQMEEFGSDKPLRDDEEK